jgi:hypothetical protein
MKAGRSRRRPLSLPPDRHLVGRVNDHSPFSRYCLRSSPEGPSGGVTGRSLPFHQQQSQLHKPCVKPGVAGRLHDHGYDEWRARFPSRRSRHACRSPPQTARSDLPRRSGLRRRTGTPRPGAKHLGQAQPDQGRPAIARHGLRNFAGLRSARRFGHPLGRTQSRRRRRTERRTLVLRSAHRQMDPQGTEHLSARRLLRPAKRLRPGPQPVSPLSRIQRQPRLALVSRNLPQQLDRLGLRPRQKPVARPAAGAGAASQPAPLRLLGQRSPGGRDLRR